MVRSDGIKKDTLRRIETKEVKIVPDDGSLGFRHRDAADSVDRITMNETGKFTITSDIETPWPTHDTRGSWNTHSGNINWAGDLLNIQGDVTPSDDNASDLGERRHQMGITLRCGRSPEPNGVPAL